jgi:hypothetical protein
MSVLFIVGCRNSIGAPPWATAASDAVSVIKKPKNNLLIFSPVFVSGFRIGFVERAFGFGFPVFVLRKTKTENPIPET